jgi:hypothetical protein
MVAGADGPEGLRNVLRTGEGQKKSDGREELAVKEKKAPASKKNK